MNADDLRAVAADIREKANAATPGPWAVDPDRWAPPGWREEVGYLRIVAGEPNPISGIRKKVVSTDGAEAGSDRDRLNYANAAHIVAWSPTVALAIADWLDVAALTADTEIRDSAGPGDHTRAAIAFVKAWRGES